MNFLMLYFSLSFFSALSAMTASIIVPCYPGHFEYLKPLCEAICHQTELPEEVVISISQCSSLDGKKLQDLIEKRYPFALIVTCTDEKLYAGQNRNRACSLANGDILICQDADDIPHAQRVEIIKRAFKTYNTSLLLHRWVPTDRKQTLPRHYSFNAIPFYLIGKWEENEVFDYIHYGNCSLVRQVFECVQWSDMKNSEDKRFLQDAMSKGFSLGMLDAFLLIYRMEYSSGN